MATAVERIIEEVKTLTPEEQQQVAAFFGSVLMPALQETTLEQERQFLEHLLAKGIIANIPTGRRLHPDPEPIVVQGEPVSETIIRERR